LPAPLRAELERLLADRQYVALVVEAPEIVPELLTSHELKLPSELQPSVFWHSAGPSRAVDEWDEVAVGLGVFREVSAPWGNTESLHLFAEEQLGRFNVLGPGANSVTPRIFAALGFATAARADASSDVWTDLSSGWGVLPRLTHFTRRDRESGGHRESWFCLTLGPADLANLDALLGQVGAIARKLRSTTIQPGIPADALGAPVETAKATWATWIEHALRTIDNGQLEKVVAARRAEFTFRSALSPAHTLLSLGSRHGDSTRFAFFRGQSVFLGVTPERLLAKRGSEVETEALAGTVRRHEASLGQGSTRQFGHKEHKEHTPVLAQILATLSPFCTTITHDASPQLRAQRQVLHLRSAVYGSLKANYHVLTLVQALHPTPAVGGCPTADALNWITQHEDFDRGLYAGPVGWVDANGDGQFNVALRSGVMRGNQATLFAGAGIVAGSDAQREFDETALKLQVLLGSLCHGPAGALL
jgi:isochorismate synthase